MRKRNAMIIANYPCHTEVGKIHTTQVFVPNGSTVEEAKEILAARGYGETINMAQTSMIGLIGEPDIKLPSEWFAQDNLKEAIHAACWLGMFAMSSGVVTGDQLLNDHGVIHQLAHLLNTPKEGSEKYERLSKADKEFIAEARRDVSNSLADLEARTPGFQRFATVPKAEPQKALEPA